MKRVSSVRREAQVESREQSNINNMSMNIEKKIETNMQKIISDIICLTGGRVIIVERFGKVNVLTPDGEHQKQLPISGGAFSVTQINQDLIAISYTNEGSIKIFNIEKETVTKVITLDKTCWGLSFFDKSLAVDLNRDEIRLIDLEGKTLKSIQVQTNFDMDYFVYSNNRVIFSDYNVRAVYCCDESGKRIWECTKHLSGPAGLCIDTYGNIIVADYASDSIKVISKDGQNIKEILRVKDSEGTRLKIPKCICFNTNESSGFICDSTGRYLVKFKLSYK